MAVPMVTIRRRNIIEKKELEIYESGPLWVVDEDVKRGKELNFRIYDELSGLYEIYLDAELKYVDDVADAITSGTSLVTISGRTDREKMKSMFFYTNSLILYLGEGVKGMYDFFIRNGGEYLYCDDSRYDGIKTQFTKRLNCENCTLIEPIGDFNGGRNKEGTTVS